MTEEKQAGGAVMLGLHQDQQLTRCLPAPPTHCLISISKAPFNTSTRRLMSHSPVNTSAPACTSLGPCVASPFSLMLQ